MLLWEVSVPHRVTVRPWLQECLPLCPVAKRCSTQRQKSLEDIQDRRPGVNPSPNFIAAMCLTLRSHSERSLDQCEIRVKLKHIAQLFSRTACFIKQMFPASSCLHLGAICGHFRFLRQSWRHPITVPLGSVTSNLGISFIGVRKSEFNSLLC